MGYLQYGTRIIKQTAQIVKLLDRGIHLKRNFKLLKYEIDKLELIINNSDDAEKTYLYYKIKEMIYLYKYFKNEPNWEIDDTIIDELDSLCESIEFNNKIYKNLIYFSNPNDYVLISPVVYKDDEHFDKNNRMAEQNKEKVLNEEFWESNNLDYILKSYIALISKKELEFNTYNFTLGYDIAIYKDKKIFSKNTIDILFGNFLNTEYDFYRTIFDYIYAIKNDKGMVDCLIKYSINNFEINKKLSIGIIKILFRNGLNLDIIDKLPSEIQNEFWEDADVLIIDPKLIGSRIIDRLFAKLKDNKNYYTYLEILELNQRNFGNEIIIKYLKELLDINEESIKQINKSKLAYLLSELYKNNNTKVEDNLKCLSDIELKFLRDYYTYDFRFSKLLFSNKPELYAEYVIKYFWVKDDNNIKERQKVFLEKISNKFNMNLNTVNSYDDLAKWAEVFLKKIRECVNDNTKGKKICKFYSICMGKIISMSPNEVNGTFPLDIFKEFIEDNYNSDFEEAMVNAKYNLRGMYTPMQGEYNLTICKFYEKSIAICKDKYPKTTKILDRLRKIYYQEYKEDRRLSENANY